MVYGITGRKDWNKVKWNYLCTVSWKFGHCYFLSDFFDVLSSNCYYFEKTRGKQLFQASNFVCFYYCCFQIKIRTKRKGKINLETKYNMI